MNKQEKNIREKKIIVFNNMKIRRIWHNEEWYYSIVDVVGVLTESSIPKRYWADLKGKLMEEGSEAYEKIVRFKLVASDGKMRETDCANKKGIFRIIQSILSKKAEPFKLWLAKIGSLSIKSRKKDEKSNCCNSNFYNVESVGNIEMFPSDPLGSLDVFSFDNYGNCNLRRVCYV